MGEAVKKTISLPANMARDVEDAAKEEGKTVSAVIQDALRIAKKQRLKREFIEAQGFWTKKAKEKGILTERDIKRYMGEN